jgi:hypothetical protein
MRRASLHARRLLWQDGNVEVIMDEPIVKNYSFTQGVGKDGMPKYFIDGSEIRDKMTWERLKNKAGQVMNESFEDVNNSMSSGMDDMSDLRQKTQIIKKAKGGKVSSASSRGDGCAQRGKTKGRMI